MLITWLEHHANIVPWQQLCQERGARLCVAPVDDRGQVMLDEFERLLSDRTRIVAFSHVSNALGTITPAGTMTELAHRYGARVLIDGAQAVSHMPVDVQSLDSDWYAFSGHKVFGPTGIGVLYGKRELLDAMPPWQGGGNMIRDVTFEHTEYQSAPVRFEAGTASIADAVGLGAALEYVERIGRENIACHEHDLLRYAVAALATIPGLQLIGTAPERAAVLSFVLRGLSPDPSYFQGRMVVIGDAAHAFSPLLAQGAAMAIEDAVALAESLASSSDVDAALRSYQSQRRPRVESIRAAVRRRTIVRGMEGPVTPELLGQHPPLFSASLKVYDELIEDPFAPAQDMPGPGHDPGTTIG
jgi:cysteine desulfurase / selenocysteine lyase